MNLDSLTIGEAKELARLMHGAASVPEHPYRIGANYFVRTVTMAQTGRLVAVTPLELVLEDAAWIADTGRFGAAVASAEFSEVEPFPAGRVIVGRTAVIDACEIGALPRAVK